LLRITGPSRRRRRDRRSSQRRRLDLLRRRHTRERVRRAVVRGYQVETMEGVFKVRPDEPAARTGELCTGRRKMGGEPPFHFPSPLRSASRF
jgi:hypothetical protein